ncbi:MAG: hypothetical protein COU40_00690 [Candidatus Moranbacteria bacterium CG10_big_fil_rev_8_21_14_0_10_35_21]|nr:MAG: hypothetical protein COU40_00690 [Candidatus Moranbacteria bacterium CG10_big_fil_rev_8_21_14_0_10_35_21]PJA88317.1 MAG: hypothetical protein CO139_03815 [Candidatus Moranbacteria bacterium CG_4_9_14_3_um_filter_36_9]
MKKITIFILVLLILALGFFLRIYNIENTPPGIYPDEAVNGKDAIKAFKNGTYELFYTDNNGREGLFINLIALSFSFFGISILALKLPSIVFGTLTILGVYLLSKELFNKRLALISSFLLAISFWAINFSRIAFRAVMLPMLLVFSFYFIFRGLRTKKWWDFAIGGFIFGIGIHTYIAWRIAPLILILMLVFFILSRRNFIKEYWKLILIFLLFSIISALPMLATFYAHPEYLESRSASISIFSPEVNNGNPVGAFLRSFSLSLIKYNFVGDMNWRHNYRPYPLLEFFTGLAFLFGFIYSLRHFFSLLIKRLFKKSLGKNLEKYAFLLIWFFLMLAPEFLTAEGNPHALRAIGMLPVVFILSGLGFENFIQKRNKAKKSVAILVLLILIFAGTFESIKYHYFWANKPKVASSFDKNLQDISHYLKTLPTKDEKYIITSNNTLIKYPIYIFNYDSPNIYYIYPNELAKIAPKNINTFHIILLEKNKQVIDELEKKYPQLKLEEKNNSLESKFYILK